MPNPTYQKRLIDLKQEKEDVLYKILEAIFKLMEQKPRTIILFLRDILVDYCHNALENDTEQPFDVKKLEDWAFKLQNWISEQSPKWNKTTTQQQQAEQQWMRLMETTVEGYIIDEKPFIVSEFKKMITESTDASDLYAVVTYFICQYYWLDRESKETKQKSLFANFTNGIDFIANFTEQLPLNTNKRCTLYQLECATGDFLVDIFLKNEQAPNLHIVGQTNRKDFYILCHLNLILANCRNFDIQLANLYPFLPTYQGKADVIIAPQIPILHPVFWTWDLIAEVLENDRWQRFDEAVWIDKLIDFGHAQTRYLLALPNNLLKHAGSSQILRTAIDNGWVESLCPTKYTETRAYPYLFVANDNTPDIAHLAQEIRKLPNGAEFVKNKYVHTSEEELAEFNERVINVDIPPPFDEFGYIYSVKMEHLGQLKRKYHPKELFFFLGNMYIILDKQNFGVDYEKITTGTSLLLLNKNKQKKEFSTYKYKKKKTGSESIVLEKVNVPLENYTLHRPFYICKQEGLINNFIGEKDQIYKLRDVVDYSVLNKTKYADEIDYSKIVVHPGYIDFTKMEEHNLPWQDKPTDIYGTYFIGNNAISPIKNNKEIPEDAIILAKENETTPFPDHTIIHYKEDLKFSFDKTTNLQPSLYPLNRQNIVIANDSWKRTQKENGWYDSLLKNRPQGKRFKSFSFEDIGTGLKWQEFFISKPAVVVSLINAPYSMCLPANAIVDIPQQTLIFTLKPGFDAEFITLLFRQLDWVAEQFDAYALEYGEGKGTKYITVDDLLDFKLPIPPLEEQQKIVLGYKARQVDQLILDIKLKEAYEQTRAIEYEVIASISHSLKNKLGIINNDLETLINILETKEAQQILNLQEPIRPIFDTEDPATTHIDTAAQIIDRLRNGFAEASDIFKTAEKMQYRKLNFQTVNLNEYFEQVKYKFAVPNQNIEVKGNTPNLVLKIDTDAMNEVIENLIINARKHGFINKEQLYHLVFE
ncbi:MAG: restriction endonuclease subunit S, partial [Chitinophagales bacterium]|nr:restriction endonuclease subunit S [Chitinophagales bacterium]